jgi:hypothetical protein
VFGTVPTLVVSVPGQSHARSQLKSYYEYKPLGRHTVNLDELYHVGVQKALDSGDSATVTQAFIAMALEW